ncbi:unnamed protein product [Meganyctiphanes norvegica]|uniref:Uncharacterized protein n=1 Tax=Meganyctiphanes norvegica TaxID=48144 RepID=A0AAV2Q5K9_MEGNR
MSSSIPFKKAVPFDSLSERVKEKESQGKNKEENEVAKDNKQFSRTETFGKDNQIDSNLQDKIHLSNYDNSVSSPGADDDSNYDVEVEYSATAESTLKKKDSINENNDHVTGDIQASSSTEYMSPPSSLPSKNTLDNAISNLKRIQEQRIANQRFLEQSKKVSSVPMISSTPKPTYSQEIKMDGTGKRPKKKKDKFQEQKSKLLEYYSKKLINMKEDQLLEQMSDSAEGSHVTVTSLTPLLNNMKRNPKESLTSTSIHLSSSNSSQSFSSNYPDIDEIPTRLSKGPSYNLSSSKSSLSNSDTNIQIIYEGSNDATNTLSINDTSINNLTHKHTLSLNDTSINNRTPQQQSLSVESSSQESTLSIYSDNEQGVKESSQQAKKMEILRKLQELQRIKTELLNQQKMASTVSESEESSTSSVDIDPTASFQNTDDKVDPVNIDPPQQRRVSFRNPRRELSTINEQETEFSDNIKFVDTSNSYHTPSREFEETFSDSSETSNSTKQHLADMHTLLYDQHKYVSGKHNKNDMNIVRENSEPLSSSYDVKQSKQYPCDYFIQKLTNSSLMPNMETRKSVTSSFSEPFPVPIADSSKDSQCQTSFSTFNQSNSPPTKIGSEYKDEISTTEKSSTEKKEHRTLYLRGGYTPSAIVKSKIFTKNSLHQKLSHSLNTTADDSAKLFRESSLNQKLGQSVSTVADDSVFIPMAAEDKLDHSMNSTADDSVFTPLVAEDTLLPGFDEEKKTLQNIKDEETATAKIPTIPSKFSSNCNSDSESVVSMPDMADILQRFGMDWAKTMMRRMEKTEQNSSSDSSLHVK